MDNLELVLEAIKEFECDWYCRHPEGKYTQEHWDEYQAEKEEWISEWLRSYDDARAEIIERIEEEQHANGFYTFQDKMDMWRFER